MANQVYSLRWNNHQLNFISIFKNLLELEELVDVTLSVEGKHIKAHKIILSACSPYFKLLFTMNSNKHPIVILNDVKYVDLKTIIEFMYFGEINVPDERLADILEVAEHLQVRGLYDPKNKNGSKDSTQRKKKRRLEHSNASLNNISQQSLDRDYASNNSPFDIKYDPTALVDVNVNDESHNSEFADDLHKNASYENHDGLPNFNVSLQEVNPSFQDRGMPDVFPYNSLEQSMVLPRFPPNSIPASGTPRRRNMKVQESENFILALEAVRSGSLGFCKAAKLYGLNNRTLWLEYKKRGYPSNRPPAGLARKTNVPALTSNPS